MPKVKFNCGNYMERIDGACFVTLDRHTMYFSHGKLIAVIYDDVLYRSEGLENGIIYKRVRAAVNRQPARRGVKMVPADELNAMVEVAIMNMAARLVDEKLGLSADALA